MLSGKNSPKSQKMVKIQKKDKNNFPKNIFENNSGYSEKYFGGPTMQRLLMLIMYLCFKKLITYDSKDFSAELFCQGDYSSLCCC